MGTTQKSQKPGFEELTARMRNTVGKSAAEFRYRAGQEELAKSCLDALKESLQLAIDLEFSTIPPYLCALWSIKDDLHSAAVSIREVVQEEMLHMALACNMLSALGGVPQITWQDFDEQQGHPPRYPTRLAGGLHPDLNVELSGLSDASLTAFMQIELPQQIFDLDTDDDWIRDPPFTSSNSQDKTSSTIGDFYKMLLANFKTLNPTFLRDRQITGPLAYSNIGDLKGVKWAIKLISHQGEGSTTSPFEDKAETDLSHFYRFEEVFMEAKLDWSPVRKRFNKGKTLPRPESWPMASPPLGGYQEEHLAGLDEEDHVTVATNLREFDRVYSHLLDLLQSTWSGGGQRTLIRAYETMFELEKYAKPLMQVEIPGRGGRTFGPCFRYVRSEP